MIKQNVTVTPDSGSNNGKLSVSVGADINFIDTDIVVAGGG